MPCNCDYMERDLHELESVRTAECLEYLLDTLDHEIPEWISDAANNYYGNVSRLNEMVIMLCELCKNMTPAMQDRIIYDGRNEKARRLADWWDRHLKADEEREAKEKEQAEAEKRMQQILSKLTDEDKKILGLGD